MGLFSQRSENGTVILVGWRIVFSTTCSQVKSVYVQRTRIIQALVREQLLNTKVSEMKVIVDKDTDKGDHYNTTATGKMVESFVSAQF